MSRFLACKASCRQDAASQSLLRRLSAVPSPGHKKLNIQTKPRDSEYFKLHHLVLSSHQIRRQIPPTAPKIERSVNSARERKGTANIFNSPNKNQTITQKTEFQSQTGLLVLPTPRFHSHAVRWMTGAPRGAEALYINITTSCT